MKILGATKFKSSPFCKLVRLVTRGVSFFESAAGQNVAGWSQLEKGWAAASSRISWPSLSEACGQPMGQPVGDPHTNASLDGSRPRPRPAEGGARRVDTLHTTKSDAVPGDAPSALILA